MLKHCALPDQGLRWLGYGRLADRPFAGLITAVLPGHAPWGVVSESIPVNAAIAGWRRSLSRRRPRFGPMLPTGTPSLALISAYDIGGVFEEQGNQLLAAGRQLRQRFAQRRVPLRREQLLLRRYGREARPDRAVCPAGSLASARLPGRHPRCQRRPERAYGRWTRSAARTAPPGHPTPACRRSRRESPGR